MTTTEANTKSSEPNVGNVDFKLEVQIIPVSDIDHSKKFYEQLGWRLDADDSPLDGLRIVQFTPPGSGASVTFGAGLTTAAPGSALAGLIVSDIEAAHDELVGRGIEVSDIWHGPPFPPEARQPGLDPDRTSYGSFFAFNDPDDTTWLVQEVTTASPQPHRRHGNGIRIHRRSPERTPARRDRPRRARQTLRAVAPFPAAGPRRGLARLVRIPHGRRAGRNRPA